MSTDITLNEIVQTDAELAEQEEWIQAVIAAEEARDDLFPEWDYWAELRVEMSREATD